MAQAFSIDEVLNAPVLGRYRRLLFFACSLLMLMDGYDAYVVSNLAPFIAAGMKAPIAAMGTVFTAQSFGMAVGFYLTPLIADRRGRRGVVVACTGLFALLTLATTQASSIGSLALIRFFAFAAFGGALPNVAALLAEFLPDSRRGQLLTWAFIFHGAGASAAGLLGPSFVQHGGWQTAFWAGGLLLLLVTPLLYVFLPESCRFLLTRDGRDPRIGATLRRIMPALDIPPDTLFSTVEPAGRGMPLADLFRDGRARLTTLLWIATALDFGATTTLSAWLPSSLHALGGIPAAQAARMTSTTALGAMLGPVLLTTLSLRLALPRALALTLTLGGAVVAGLALVPQLHAAGWLLAFAIGLVVYGSQAGLNGLIGSIYPTSMRATGIGWAGGVGRIAAIFGPGLIAGMIAARWQTSTIYLAMAAPFLLCALTMLFVPRPIVGGGR